MVLYNLGEFIRYTLEEEKWKYRDYLYTGNRVTDTLFNEVFTPPNPSCLSEPLLLLVSFKVLTHFKDNSNNMFSVSHCRLAPSAFLFLLLLLCSCGVHAAYSETLAKSALYFSKASYCDVPSIDNWSCESCHKLTSFHVTKVFTNHSYGTLAYMGVSEDRIVISFRGSENIPNWISNMKFGKETYPNATCKGCSVHIGFYHSFLSLRNEMWVELQRLVAEYPRRPVLITGHSLGGAMAVLAAADFAAQAYATGTVPQFELYTFGAPRVGNDAFTAWMAALFCSGKHEAYRVTHNRDVVPHLPPMLFGFEQTAGEVWYSGDGEGNYRTCSDVTGANCSSEKVEEDSKCSNSLYPISVSDHLEYLGVCTSCSCRKRRTRSLEEANELSPRLKWLVILDHMYQHGGKGGNTQIFADFMSGFMDKDATK
ncbi:lipase [Trypanosoma theileri]|uniref:Lipase n=1 Tax=Trypanosoma theileri TaxID=67003 RepID=A0A1X0NZH3_9TRYP|nr:lipase [Trypanosoma theileri]ORC89948.1 lipase [Trypanosoma theileri]